MKAFIISQFSYCPLVQMFHSKRLGKKTIVLHERALKITYWDKTSSFNELLENKNSISIHHKNLQGLAMEMYKISNNMSTTILNNIFAPRATPYNLGTPVSLKIKKIQKSTQSIIVLKA